MSEQHDTSVAGGATFMSSLNETELNSLLEPERHVFPEYLFKSTWLPFFAGLTDEISGKKATISDWLDVAGTAYNEVDIVDQDGKVLFTVPPLLRDTPLMEKRHPNDTMREAMAEYINYASLHPKMGKAYLEKVISSKIPRKPADVRYIRRWNDIFVRYGLPPIELTPIMKQAMDAIERFEASKQRAVASEKQSNKNPTEISYNDEDDSI